jgi:SAM-dependent methyltransferase
MKIEFDHPTRGRHYRRANEEHPGVRRREVEHMLEVIRPKPGETIVDFGCGNGVLTRPLAERVGPGGSVIALDNSRASMKNLLARLDERNTRCFVLGEPVLPLPDGSVDAVVTLANEGPAPGRAPRHRRHRGGHQRTALLRRARRSLLQHRAQAPLSQPRLGRQAVRPRATALGALGTG